MSPISRLGLYIKIPLYICHYIIIFLRNTRFLILLVSIWEKAFCILNTEWKQMHWHNENLWEWFCYVLLVIRWYYDSCTRQVWHQTLFINSRDTQVDCHYQGWYTDIKRWTGAVWLPWYCDMGRGLLWSGLWSNSNLQWKILYWDGKHYNLCVNCMEMAPGFFSLISLLGHYYYNYYYLLLCHMM